MVRNRWAISPEGTGGNTSASRIRKGERMNRIQAITVTTEKVLCYFICRIFFPEMVNKLNIIQLGNRI